MKGKLVIFDGIDGSGKTTQAKFFSKKFKALYLKESGGDKNLDIIKKLILKNILPLTELFLFLANRSEVFFKIKNFLNLGQNIILDRSFPSTLAYQLEAKNLKKYISIKEYLKIDLLARNGIIPDLIIIFDLPVKTALSRLKHKNKFEYKDFLEKARKAYLKLAKNFNWKLVDASLPIPQVREQIYQILKNISFFK
jgi:dTMP kinase